MLIALHWSNLEREYSLSNKPSMSSEKVQKPLILITNDDGVSAKGIKELTEEARKYGEVVVVAPDGPRSGQSSAITVDRPLRVTIVTKEEDCLVYRCNGTPVDCVKLAFSQLLDRKPDLVLSGFNHGSNSSVSVLYSGTMGGALEGCVHNVPSLGLSLCDLSADADFTNAQKSAGILIRETLENGLPHGVCLNINIPKGEIKGIRPCRQSKGRWNEEFEKRTDPHGREYYWLTGYFDNAEEHAEDTDENAIAQGFVSVVPVTVDMTAHFFNSELWGWSLK